MADSCNCPECDTLMDCQLSEYVCPSCGHRESAITGMEVKRSGAESVRKPGTLELPPSQINDSAIDCKDQPEKPGPEPGVDQKLRAEKRYILLYLICFFLLLAIWVSTAKISSELSSRALLIIVIIWAVGSCGMLYFALHTNTAWVKFGCILCLGLAVIRNIATMFSPAVAAAVIVVPPGLKIAFGILGLIYAVWLISILARELSQSRD